MKDLFLLIFFALMAPIWGVNIEREIIRDGSEVSIDTPFASLPAGGFLPIRITIKNESSKEMKWDFSFKARYEDYYGYGFRSGGKNDNQIQSGSILTCPNKETRSFDLLIPIHQYAPQSMGERIVSIVGKSKTHQAEFFGVFQKETPNFAVLFSKELLSDHHSKIKNSFKDRGYRYSSYALTNNELDPAFFSEDWRAYCGYEGLVLTRKEYEKLSPGVLVALDQWVRSGGVLVVASDSQTVIPGFQKGAIQHGLGMKAFFLSGIDHEIFDPNQISALFRKKTRLADQLGRQYKSNDWVVGFALGERNFSKGLLLFALIIFAIVVGPINLYLFANRHRRHRLFITTPIISIVTSLLLVSFIMLRDGFGGDGARAVAIEVGGPNDKSAVILQEQFVRTGIILSSDFGLDGNSVLFTPSPKATDLNLSDSVSSLGNYRLEFEKNDDGWEIEGNIFQSRSETAQFLKSVVPSREHLALISGREKVPQVTSSFSYSLRNVFFTDSEGGIWQVDEIGSGASATMSKTNLGSRREAIAKFTDRFSKSNREVMERLLARPNSFVALADDAPTIATHDSIDWQPTPTIITGLLSQSNL